MGIILRRKLYDKKIGQILMYLFDFLINYKSTLILILH